MIWKWLIGVVLACAVVIIAVEYRSFLSNRQYENARNSLDKLVAEKSAETFAGKAISAHGLEPDPANAVLHIGRQIAGPSEDPDYFMPVSGRISDFAANPERQIETRKTVERNQECTAELRKLSERRIGAQRILTYEDIQNFNLSIGKIVNLYCDRMALAILVDDKENANNILKESCYFLKVTSFPLYFTQLAKFNTALGVWLVHIYGNYINHYELTESEMNDFADVLQNLKEIVKDSFQLALRGECLFLSEKLSANTPHIYWRMDKYDDYFHTLKELPGNSWSLADRIFNIAAAFSQQYGNFDDYYSFERSVRTAERELSEAAPLVRNYCRLFWVIYQNELGLYTQLKCCIVELHLLKYQKARKHLPHALTELSEVGLEKKSWTDPFTGQSFSLKVDDPEKRFQVLHRGRRNWGRSVRYR